MVKWILDAKDEPKFIKGETPLTDIPVFAHRSRSSAFTRH